MLFNIYKQIHRQIFINKCVTHDKRHRSQTTAIYRFSFMTMLTKAYSSYLSVYQHNVHTGTFILWPTFGNDTNGRTSQIDQPKLCQADELSSGFLNRYLTNGNRVIKRGRKTPQP